jgi:hypothetical protein
MKEAIKLELDINHVNVILHALTKMPYEQVAHTIEELKTQLHPQAQVKVSQ